ncbi:MAG: YkgJ family cysteine cluster protein [Candidatus Cyclobacteriaceae bacterium M3_2C_046]
MDKVYQEVIQAAGHNHQKNKTYFKKLKKQKRLNLDLPIHEIHDQVFQQISCLECGNCCRTTGPLFTEKDIERIAGHLRLKPAKFAEQYLRIDEDGDYVFKAMPCPFLGVDNYCSIYQARPKACREYPHTNRKNMRQILNLSLKNTLICPAVYHIFEKLKEKLPT